MDGTIQPDLYRGRALPVALIASLQSYLDQQTNSRLQFFELPAQACQRTVDQPIKLYYQALQNDTILHLMTGAFTNPEVGQQRFMNYVSMQDCPEPAIVARALMRNDPANENVSLDEFNCQVLACLLYTSDAADE